MTGNDRAAACLAMFASPGVGRHVLAALAHHHRALDLAGRADPEFTAFLAELGRRSVSRRQLHPWPAGPAHDGGTGTSPAVALVDVGEAAALIGVSRRTFERHLAGVDGLTVRVGRRRLVDVVGLLDRLTEGTAA